MWGPQADQIGRLEGEQLFSYLARNVPTAPPAEAAASGDQGPQEVPPPHAFLRSLPVFPTMLPGQRTSLGPTGSATCPPAVIAAVAGSAAALPMSLQVGFLTPLTYRVALSALHAHAMLS